MPFYLIFSFVTPDIKGFPRAMGQFAMIKTILECGVNLLRRLIAMLGHNE